MHDKINNDSIIEPEPPLWLKLFLGTAVILVVGTVALVFWCLFHCNLF